MSAVAASSERPPRLCPRLRRLVAGRELSIKSLGHLRLHCPCAVCDALRKNPPICEQCGVPVLVGHPRCEERFRPGFWVEYERTHRRGKRIDAIADDAQALHVRGLRDFTDAELAAMVKQYGPLSSEAEAKRAGTDTRTPKQRIAYGHGSKRKP